MMERRSFLKKLVGSALLAAAPVQALASQTGVASRTADDERLFTETRLMMGTFVTLTVSGAEASRAAEAMHSAFTAMAQAEALLTRFSGASALGQLNSGGLLHDVPAELSDVVQASLVIHGQTGGAFDPTVLPVMEVLAGGHVQRSELEEARELVGMGRVRIDGRDVRFERGGMRMSLDAIAKGYIADLAVKNLRASGLEDFLVNAGGDIVARGTKAGRPWKVAVENPGRYQGRTEYLAVCSLSDRAMATSGDYESAARGVRHLVDPLARGVSPLQSATVLAPTAMEADALATALCVMTEPLAFIESMPHTACLLVMADGTVRTSSRWA